MKKLFLSCIQLLMTALLVTGSASAQKTMAKASAETSLPLNPDASFTEGSNEAVKSGSATKDIPVRAIRNFNRDYGSANNVKWHSSEKTNVASFNQNGISNTVVYLKNGRWLHTLLNYDETNLPEGVRSIIKENFRNYEITWVTEVHEANKVMYFVNIQNDRRFKQVYVCNDEFGIYKDYKLSINR
jgi:hypothetical protein